MKKHKLNDMYNNEARIGSFHIGLILVEVSFLVAKNLITKISQRVYEVGWCIPAVL